MSTPTCSSGWGSSAEEFDPHAFDADEVNAFLGGRVGIA